MVRLANNTVNQTDDDISEDIEVLMGVIKNAIEQHYPEMQSGEPNPRTAQIIIRTLTLMGVACLASLKFGGEFTDDEFEDVCERIYQSVIRNAISLVLFYSQTKGQS